MGDSSHFLSSYDAPGSVLSSFKAFPEHQAKMSIYTMGMKPLLTKSPSFCFHGNTRAHAQWEDKMGTRVYIQDLPPPHPTTHPISRMTLKHHFRHTGVGGFWWQTLFQLDDNEERCMMWFNVWFSTYWNNFKIPAFFQRGWVPSSLSGALLETNSTYSDGGWLTFAVCLLWWNATKPLPFQGPGLRS